MSLVLWIVPYSLRQCSYTQGIWTSCDSLSQRVASKSKSFAASNRPRPAAPANPELLKELRESGHVILEHPGYPLRNKAILERFGYLLPMNRYQQWLHKI